MRKEEIIANFFIAFGLDENEEYMTNFRLNKLMYFAQAWSLAMGRGPLFDERIEAWPHGPVIPSIYHKYKTYGKEPIERVDVDFSIAALSDDDVQFIAAVMARYGKYSTSGLYQIVHAEDSPWNKAVKTQSRIIPTEDITAYFHRQKPPTLIGDGGSLPAVGYRNECGAYVLPAEYDDGLIYG